MPPVIGIEITYMLKQGKWKTKTKYITKEEFSEYENNTEYKIISAR